MSDIVLTASGELSFPEAGDALAVRERIVALQRRMEQGEKIELPVENFYAKGMYTRKLFIPKGTLIIGKIHRQECVNIVAAGDISVLTETGSGRLKAGFTVVSPPGLQKVGYAHEDTVFINVFQTEETDLDKLEELLTWDSYEAMEGLALSPELLKIEA